MRTSVKRVIECVILPGLWCLMAGMGSQVSFCQVALPPQMSVADATTRVKAGEFNNYHIEIIARNGGRDAIPLLEKRFDVETEPLRKAKLAEALVKLGATDESYWTYIKELAEVAIHSDAPEILVYGDAGKAVAGPAPAFVLWAEQNHVELPVASQNALLNYPSAIQLLGQSGDPRALPLLREALASPDYHVEIKAAQALADMGDLSSIPDIVKACEKAPKEVATGMARYLIPLADTRAQEAVIRFVPEQEIEDYRAGLQQSNGVKR